MFHDAVSRLGASPFITFYDADSRIELSGVTFSNWVMKTANLFEDLGGDVEEPVALGLSESNPGHWVNLIWVSAVWYAGGHVIQGVPHDAAFAVVGPEDERRGDITVACTLHPLGRGFSAPPQGAVDYADVLAQPDEALPGSPGDRDPAWGPITHSGLDRVPGRADRRIFVNPKCGWDFLEEALVAPAMGGGSSVIVVGLDDGEIERVARAERVTDAAS